MKYDILFCMEFDGKLKSLGEVYMNRSVASIVHESFVVSDFNYISQIQICMAADDSHLHKFLYHCKIPHNADMSVEIFFS